MTEQKLVRLGKQEIDDMQSIFEDAEIISDDEKKSLNQKRERGRTDNLVLGQLFLYCFDILSDYSYLFESEEKKNLQKNVQVYLVSFLGIVPKLRDLLGNYEENGIGSYWDGERIKDYVRPNRDKMNSLVNVFFGIIRGEDI